MLVDLSPDEEQPKELTCVVDPSPEALRDATLGGVAATHSFSGPVEQNPGGHRTVSTLNPPSATTFQEPRDPPESAIPHRSADATLKRNGRR